MLHHLQLHQNLQQKMEANFGKLTSMHFHAWKKGLKTGLYYLRTKAAADAIKFTIVKDEKSQTMEDKQAAVQCSIDNQDDCEIALGTERFEHLCDLFETLSTNVTLSKLILAIWRVSMMDSRPKGGAKLVRR